MADGAEHRIQMPDAATSKAAAAPEKWLNYFVRLLAVIESVGNAFGTLAFTWATVVLLSGYPTVLRSKDDFWFATAIVFLEAARFLGGKGLIVLERTMDAEGAELEILIGLSSQICKFIPEEFSQELEHGQIKRRFIKRLVDTLNANMNPSSQCPGIRRVVLEQSIYMMEYNSRCANCFNEYQMMDALSFVELTPSRAENYMVFLGDAGFMECNISLSALVDRAKELMGRQWLQGSQITWLVSMMAADGSVVAEHRIQMPAVASESGQADHKAVAAAPENWLNYFVRLLAGIESAGNALGTLAFTWGTVVLLGGFPSNLKDDFGYATAIFFLEATRPLSWNGLMVIVFFSVSTVSTIVWDVPQPRIVFAIMVVLFAAGQFLCAEVLGLRLRINNRLRRQISLWSPVVALSILASCIYRDHRSSLAMRIVYGLLLVVVLLVTISRLQFPIIINRVQGALGRKYVFWRPFILYSCMLTEIVMSMFMVDKLHPYALVYVDIEALAIVSFGNLQIPAAIARVVLAGLCLHPKGYDGQGGTAHIAPSLKIFYGMVLGQGILYIVAGILEVFSFIPRRSLIRNGGFTGQWGVESINLYYAYAYDKYMEGGLFASKRISLSNFAMDSLNSDLSKNQLYAVRMMNTLLQSDLTRARLLEKLTGSTQTMARLISKLDWSSRHHRATIRLYAAKVTAELAKNLRVVTVPGTLQLVSTLLDADGKPKRGHPLLDTGDDQDHFVDIADRQDKKHDIAGDQEQTGDTDNLLETPTRSMHINDQRYIPRIWQRILEYWSIPKEQPLTDHDLLPALGMSIIHSLAGCDQNNCVEIDRVSDLIPKIIGFTSFRSAMVNSEAQRKVLLKSSLKVLQRLTSIEGEIGITLRYKISKHPFLLRNLAEILGDSSSSSNNNQELRRLVAGILRNLAIDRDTRQEIGQMKMLITRLLKAFLDSNGSFSSDVDCLLPKVAGQALLEHGQIKRRFIKRLVDALNTECKLNANMKPSAHCPGIRRVILEQSIYMMECNSRYAKCFNEFRMMDAVSMVEETPSRAEKYMFFLGDMDFMECKTALSALVDRAKELMSRQWLHDINSANRRKL
uniref:BLE2 protein n=1 Tax=Oryza rufipogon TaxID=4529 RepID=A0A0E0QC34_ORYRU